MIKSWVELSQKTIKNETVEWDGEAKSLTINVPAARNPVLIVFDNQSKSALTATLATACNYWMIQRICATGNLHYSRRSRGHRAMKYSLSVVESEEATELEVTLDGKEIIITLAVGGNTVDAIVSAINEELEGFTASGTGGTISTALEPIKFTGGQTEVWADYFELQETAFSLAVRIRKSALLWAVPSVPKIS